MGVAIEIGLPGQTHADALALLAARPFDAFNGDGGRILDEKLRGRLIQLAEAGELRGDRGEAGGLPLDGGPSSPRGVGARVGEAGPGAPPAPPAPAAPPRAGPLPGRGP